MTEQTEYVQGRRADVEWLINKSPRLAYARAMDIGFIPFPFLITGTFSASGTPAPVIKQTPTDLLSSDVLIRRVFIDIQTPNAFTGDEFKPLSDANYNITSGIQTRLQIEGRSRWLTEFFSLGAMEGDSMVSDAEPWVLLEEQTLSMDFKVTTALPAGYNGLVVNVNFLGRVPATDAVWRMSYQEATDNLEKMGYDVRMARKTFLGGG